MKNTNVTEQLTRIEEILKGQAERVMNFNEACKYLNISKSYGYKLTCRNIIPYYKPNGKLIYFSKIELDKWILRGKNKSIDELEAETRILK